MQIEINEDITGQVQSLTTIKLGKKDYYYFTDWLLKVGVATVTSELEKNPELTLGDIVMLQYRKHGFH